MTARPYISVKRSLPVADVPFLPVLVTQIITVDLPRPISVNHIWRLGTKSMRKSPAYKKWMAAADALSLAQHIHRGLKPIKGPFEATLLVADTGQRGDIDNFMKAPLDWAQSRELILNDSYCRKSTSEFVEKHRAPEGAKLILTELA